MVLCVLSFHFECSRFKNSASLQHISIFLKDIKVLLSDQVYVVNVLGKILIAGNFALFKVSRPSPLYHVRAYGKFGLVVGLTSFMDMKLCMMEMDPTYFRLKSI